MSCKIVYSDNKEYILETRYSMSTAANDSDWLSMNVLRGKRNIIPIDARLINHEQ